MTLVARQPMLRATSTEAEAHHDSHHLLSFRNRRRGVSPDGLVHCCGLLGCAREPRRKRRSRARCARARDVVDMSLVPLLFHGRRRTPSEPPARHSRADELRDVRRLRGSSKTATSQILCQNHVKRRESGACGIAFEGTRPGQAISPQRTYPGYRVRRPGVTAVGSCSAEIFGSSSLACRATPVGSSLTGVLLPFTPPRNHEFCRTFCRTSRPPGERELPLPVPQRLRSEGDPGAARANRPVACGAGRVAAAVGSGSDDDFPPQGL